MYDPSTGKAADVSEPTGSTVPRRQLGRYLRDARMKARMTVRAAAQEMEWSEPKIWRIETGQTAMRGHDVDLMCRIYGVPAELTAALVGLAKETKSRGWWHAYGDVIPSWFDVYVGLEAAAGELCWYESELVPGLLQTADYAAALIRTAVPDLDPDELDRRVAFRISRQALLTRPVAPPQLTVVLNESVIRRPVGGRAVLSGQLVRLIDVGELPNVSVRVLPFAAGMHRGVLSGPFVLLRFPDDGRDVEPPVVYMENPTGALYLDKPQEIDYYGSAFGDVLDRTDETASRELMAAAVRELRE